MPPSNCRKNRSLQLEGRALARLLLPVYLEIRSSAAGAAPSKVRWVALDLDHVFATGESTHFFA
jgi:hypothetical protein